WLFSLSQRACGSPLPADDAGVSAERPARAPLRPAKDGGQAASRSHGGWSLSATAAPRLRTWRRHDAHGAARTRPRRAELLLLGTWHDTAGEPLIGGALRSEPQPIWQT